MSVWQPRCNRAVKQDDWKNGERENRERTFSVSGFDPPRLHLNPRRKASKRRIGKDVRGGVNRRGYGRNDKTPRGSTPGSCVK